MEQSICLRLLSLFGVPEPSPPCAISFPAHRCIVATFGSNKKDDGLAHIQRIAVCFTQVFRIASIAGKQRWEYQH